MNEEKKHWGEDESETFSKYGEIYVPERAVQYQVIVQLLSSIPYLQQVVELGCGEGLLSEKVLNQFPEAKVTGMDLSPLMLEKTRVRLSAFGSRFATVAFDLGAMQWRSQLGKVSAFISSLAIHHLDDGQKKSLYQDLFDHLIDNGMVVIADIVRPLSNIGHEIAGDLWDRYVKQKSESLHQQAAYKTFKGEGWNHFQNPGLDPIDKPSSLLDQLLWLLEAGFKEVDVYWMYAGHAIFAGRKC